MSALKYANEGMNSKRTCCAVVFVINPFHYLVKL